MTTRTLFVVLAAFGLLSGCGRAHQGPGRLPAGVVFITERWPHDGGFEPGPIRKYVNGRLISIIREGKLIVARDAASASLVYDWSRRTVQRTRGGRVWHFNPCHDPNGARIVELSPSGKRGVCISIYSEHFLMLFDADNPDATAHVIFRGSVDSPQPVTWIDETHIAVMELRRGNCPYYDRYGYYPTNLAIIDTRGRVISRGPCMAGVIAGSRGLIYLQYFDDGGPMGFFDSVLGRPSGAAYFSIDRGRSWQRGSAAFQDANGVVYYWPDYRNDGTLVDDTGRVVATSTFDAEWAPEK